MSEVAVLDISGSGPGLVPAFRCYILSRHVKALPGDSVEAQLVCAHDLDTPGDSVPSGRHRLIARLRFLEIGRLLPSLGLVLASLALATVVRPLVASGAVTFVWVAVAMMAAYHRHDRLIVFRGGGQVAFVFVITVSALVLVWRREAFDRGRSE